ncbi:3-oxoacyl-ACP reductase [Brevibacterium sediminis]
MSNPQAFTSEALPLDEQVVLVTGSGRGLGAAIAKAFAPEGAALVINYRYSAETAEELAEAVRARGGRAVDAMFETAAAEFGTPVSTVVNNALADFSFNGDERQPADEIDYSDFADQFRGSVEGAVNTIQAAMHGFRELGSGRVINIGTNLFQDPVVPYHDYTAGKAALLSLTRTFAKDLGPAGVRVNMVSGGLLRTTDASSATPEEVFDQIAAASALRRVTTPEDFASAVVFFASPASRAVTGQNLIVDNGLVMG